MKFTFPPESRPLEGYTIKRAIQRGGFGEVYYALSDAGKEVALKLLQQNLEVELRGVSQCLNLKHPNLVTIFDIRTDKDGDHWIVMEYVSGKSLERIVEDCDGPMPPDEVLRWLTGIAAGLGFLHDRGIVHRDLKPGNIYREDGVVKIGDVGLAKYISQSRRNAQTESVGTVYYMAPEVARGRYGHEVDIYSLGVVLYEMLTGQVPFDGESTAEILMKHLSEKPDLAPVPPRFRPVLARALEKDPMRRTPSVGQLADEFCRAADGRAVATELPADSFVGAAREEQREPAFHRHAAGDARVEDRAAARWARIEEREGIRASKEELKRAKKRLKDQLKAAKKGRQFGAPEWTAGVPAAAGSRDVARGTSNGAPARPAQSGRSEQIRFWLTLAAITIVVMAIFAPRALPGVVGGVFWAGVYGTLGYAIYRFIVFFSRSPAAVATGHRTGAAATMDENAAARQSVEPVVRPPAAPAIPASRARQYAEALTPSTARTISLRHRTTELTGSMTFAVLATALITAGVATFTPLLRDPIRIAFFGTTVLAATWAVLAVSKVFEGTRVTSGRRRLVTMLAGLVVGAAVYSLDQFLLVDFERWEFGMAVPHSSSRSVGIHPLLQGLEPTLLGYAVFFAGLFVGRHWWRHADAFRSKRVRVSSVLLTTLLGWVWSMVVGFPMLWGVILAATISSVLQLSAVWTPHEDRRRMVEAQRLAYDGLPRPSPR